MLIPESFGHYDRYRLADDFTGIIGLPLISNCSLAAMIPLNCWSGLPLILMSAPDISVDVVFFLVLVPATVVFLKGGCLRKERLLSAKSPEICQTL